MTISISPDYFQGTCYLEDRVSLERCLNTVCNYLPVKDSWVIRNKPLFCGELFTNSFKSVRGKLFGGFRREVKNYKLLLQIPGSYWSQLENKKRLTLLKFLTLYGFHITRFDIALDDYSRRISFDAVKKAGELGNYRLVNSYKCVESAIIRGSSIVPTCYFGSAQKMLRFYNAEVVHGHKADRWELQLRGAHADSVVSEFLKNPQSLGKFLTGAVDFGYQTNKSWDSFSRFNWWESLRQESQGSLKIVLPTFNPCFERAEAWLYNQVAPTLAVAFHGYGTKGFNQLLEDLVLDGTKRLKPYHSKWIDELKKEFQTNG
ncbi:MAG: replication initiation factor domain-containing protein [Crocosphaera sp.]